MIKCPGLSQNSLCRFETAPHIPAIMSVPELLSGLLAKDRIILFDVGAKGGTFELPRLAGFSDCFGFEPNPAEYAKLDAAQHSKKHPKYHRASYFPLALNEEEGTVSFHISQHAAYSSLLEVDWYTHERHLGLMPPYSEWKKALELKEKIAVRATTLDIISAELGLACIDFLKLDTQGTELKVLHGGRQLLADKNISVIKCEVTFFPVYKGQYLFSDVDQFLRKHGFEFVDCLFYESLLQGEGEKNTKRSSAIPDVWETPRYASGGDAIYILDFPKAVIENKSARALKSGLIMAEMGYMSIAQQVLRDHADFTSEEIKCVLKYFASRSVKARLKEMLKPWLPPIVKSVIRFFLKI